ncbi:MAG: hypothetical protein ACK5LL_14800 [Suipraeoptans sp.]
MIITTEEKAMQVDAIVISSNTICGYSSSEKTDDIKVSSHLKKLLSQNGIDKMTVKIFNDYKSFLTRAEGLNSMRSVDKSENSRFENEVKKTILSTCM